MEPGSSRNRIYLPIAFALVLAGGILLGNRITDITSRKNDAIPFTRPQHHDKVTDIITYIEQDYVDSISREELVEGAITGILDNLDPHSQYIPASDFHEVNDPLNGNFEGIGIQFRIEKDTIMVIQTIAKGPSEKVGLLAGDRIVMIDDTLVAGIGIENRDAVRKLKGKRGTQVKVGVHRRGVAGLIDFTITRDVIPTYSVDIAYMVDEKTGYIKLNKFAVTTYDEFIDAMEKLASQGMEKLILDLRGNFGGYLQAAINISDEFLPDKKLIVYTEGNSRPNNYAYATEKGIFENKPLVVLIDEASASASEIVAGALQDNDRGVIVGRRSFGKGLVQEQLNFPDGSAVRLTVARYHTPTGRNIQQPYEKGSKDYYEDHYERYVSGEMLDADSIVFNDSLKYTTPGGKIVYGGGGIMPDVYVSLKAEEKDRLYNTLVHRNAIFQYAFEYTDSNRPKLAEYRTFEQFNREFEVTTEMFSGLLKEAGKDNVTFTSAEVRDSEEKIRMLMKSYIARNLFDDAGFYPIYHQIDKAFLAAMEEIKKF
jgi:carboxyl-terminal processing protease